MSSVPSNPPSTKKLNEDDTIPPFAVLKRSHSDSSTHVIMPSDTKKRNWNHLKSEAPAGEIWLAQEYMPTLFSLGEWRVFVVGGAMIQVVHTHRNRNGSWSGTMVQSYWSLEELQ